MTYAADVVNQYTAVGGVARTHDNNGNLKDDGTYVFSYDFQNRLVQVRQSGTLTLIADYHYDALGRRVEKVLAAGTTTRYLLDGVEVVEEYDAVGNWQARYVYEDGIDRPRCMDRADIADVNGNQNTTEVLRFHYHQQALGSVTEVTQPTGAVVEWVTYDVYGQPSIRDQLGNGIAQSAIGSPYLFTGREYDQEDGLYVYRARAYDPVGGRYLQRDPSGHVDGLGLHEYAGSAPSTRWDPDGRDDTHGRDRNLSKETKKIVIRYDGSTKDKEDAVRDAIEDWNENNPDDKISPSRTEDIVSTIVGQGHQGYMAPITDVERTYRVKGGKVVSVCVKRAYIKAAIIVVPDDASEDLLNHELDHWEAAQDAIDASNAALPGHPEPGGDGHPDATRGGRGNRMTPEEYKKWKKEAAKAVRDALEEPDKKDAEGKRVPWKKNVEHGSPKPYSTYLGDR